MEASTWIPCATAMPQKGRLVVIANDAWQTDPIWFGRLTEFGWEAGNGEPLHGSAESGLPDAAPTHWQPLPLRAVKVPVRPRPVPPPLGHKPGSEIVRVDYTRQPLTGHCAICHEPDIMGVIDLDLDLPICQACVPFSIHVAASLRDAQFRIPAPDLIQRNP